MVFPLPVIIPSAMGGAIVPPMFLARFLLGCLFYLGGVQVNLHSTLADFTAGPVRHMGHLTLLCPVQLEHHHVELRRPSGP